MPKTVYPDAGENLDEELSEASRRKLDALGGLVVHYGRPESDEQYLRRIGDAQAILLGWDLPSEVMLAAPALEIVVFTGIGAARFVDLPKAAAKGITVCKLPGILGQHGGGARIGLAARGRAPRSPSRCGFARRALEPDVDGHGTPGPHPRNRRLRRHRAAFRRARQGHRDAGDGLDPQPRSGAGAGGRSRVRGPRSPARRKRCSLTPRGGDAGDRGHDRCRRARPDEARRGARQHRAGRAGGRGCADRGPPQRFEFAPPASTCTARSPCLLPTPYSVSTTWC